MTRLRRQRKYVPNMAELNAVCEINYLKLNRLWPNMARDSGLRVNMSTEHGIPAVMVLLCQEQFAYTADIVLTLDLPSMPENIGRVDLYIRVYQDMRMAEVVSGGHGKQFEGIYQYPNDKMLQVDEKAQLNKFLSEWLSHALHHGMLEMPKSATFKGDLDH
ncbi:DUF1249 domain-containing protein [Salinibius halmophilus]|uniref:DUF1249 domain-containing protein n=1 Tax=Salinibius halmophilus TaxID=1853216 RepID=UPI001314D8D3|nr:DUF1249 domain-containing protein [Salinibius halmophilus]